MELSEQKALDLVVQRLRQKFPEVAPGTIRDEVTRIHQAYDRSRVRTYVPILVERDVADLLARPLVAP